jgi:ATP-dependent protease Clp ATPase subunit
MSVAVYNHYKRLMQQQDDEWRLKKNTSMGQTGKEKIGG